MYVIIYKKSVEKDFRKLDPVVRKRIFKKIDTLASNPRPDGVTKLSGEENLYRIRQGEYRIVYQIQDEKLIIRIVRVGHRSDVYRNI
jgi:mRNA interferase RelE/StbE